ncbi:hypothetical protein KSD_54510 [Ktedonobacter sp. SOSP1-85]|nr:hypothetical protein KSD_54510 [Ktedonobacter sp. SOSP1-85]
MHDVQSVLMWHSTNRARLGHRRFQGLLAPRVTSTEYIEAHPCDYCHQPCAQVREAAGIGAAEAQPGLLHGIVHLVEPTQQPIGHCPQVGALGLEALR